jgi:hypothetical protein
VTGFPGLPSQGRVIADIEMVLTIDENIVDIARPTSTPPLVLPRFR